MFDLENLIQPEQLSIVLVTTFLVVGFIFIGNYMKKLDYTKSPKGLAAVGVLFVEMVTNMTVVNMGEKYGKPMSMYIGSVFIYLLFANTFGLFGFAAPTGNLSVTLVLAFISWALIQGVSIKHKGVKGYIKSFFEPLFPFVIPNIVGLFAPLISLSMRLFGNILAGGVIMGLVYGFGAWLSSFIPLIGGIDVVSVLLAPVLHLYFDLFAGFLQAFLFVTLTQMFIAVEYTE